MARSITGGRYARETIKADGTMTRRFEYALVRRERPVKRTGEAGGRKPIWGAMGFVVMGVMGWTFFFLFGSAATLRTHRIDRPQDLRLVRFTSWRSRAGDVLTRDAVLILAMHRLRYRQETRDGGATVETVGAQAEVRWGTTGVGIIGSGVLPLVVYFGLKRAARVERRK
jgi:hypothetical protein